MSRKHAFDGLHNFRDFGGYAAGGRQMVRGRLFRSAHHALASDADLERLAGLNIAAIVDLRRRDEREREPSRRWAGCRAVVVENDDPDEGRVSWGEFMASWDLTRETFRSYILDYYTAAPHLPRLVGLYRQYFDALAVIDGGLLVHCSAGKDRTGLIVALTHTLAGVHRDDIIEDYLLTNDPARFNAFGAKWAENIRAERGVGPDLDVIRFVMSVDAEYLERSFDTIEKRHGDIERYLRDVLDVSRDKQAAIERRLFG